MKSSCSQLKVANVELLLALPAGGLLVAAEVAAIVFVWMQLQHAVLHALAFI
jgi:predicted phosphoribosyltransferase